MEGTTARTKDGFVHQGNNGFDKGLLTTAAVPSSPLPPPNMVFDVCIVGAGFAGLIAARELSLRRRSVLIIEARDRIGGRTFTTEIENEKHEIGGAWVHWSQPHIWTELTRYGFGISETQGAVADHISALLDNGSRLEKLSMTELLPQICHMMNEYSNVDGVHGRTVLPLPHDPLSTLETVQMYDKLSMQDRLDQIADLFKDKKELYEIMDAYLSMNSQCRLSESGFLDHLRWWALGDYDTSRLFDKTSRYKITQGTSALAQAILRDCRDVKLLLSTPIVSVNRTDDNNVAIHTQNGQIYTARSTIITIPLNTLQQIEFSPPLQTEKQRAIGEAQCLGGSKFTVKLAKPIGNWTAYAPYPSPITMAFTDDEEGTTIIAFGMEDLLDIQDFNAVQRELRRFLPDIEVKYVIGHDWRGDPLTHGTWGWYRTGQMTSNLLALQTHEPPIFFASGDTANGWRGFMDGAIESSLSTVRHVQRYLRKQH